MTSALPRVMAHAAGTPILAAENPSTMTEVIVGQQIEALSFGVLIGKLQLNTNIINPVLPTDSFDLKITGANGRGL